MSFTPSPERNLILPDKEEKTTTSGFIIVTDERDKPLVGTIVKLGENSRYKKDMEGKKVSFSRYGTDEIRVGTDIYCVASDAAILGFYD